MHLNNITVLFSHITILLFLGCDSSGQKAYTVNKSEILGKWVIQNIDLITDPIMVTPSDTMDLVTMFGSEVWSLAEGKKFEFKDGGVLLTDILANDPKLSAEIADWVEVSKIISFRYEFDQELVVSIESDGELVMKSPVKVISLDSNEMIWEIGALYKVTLAKLK